VFLYKFRIDMNDIVVLFHFYSRRNKSKKHVSCLFINITVDRVPWQRSFCEILRESRLLLYHRFIAIVRIAKSKRCASDKLTFLEFEHCMVIRF